MSNLIKRNFSLDPFLNFGVGFDRLFDDFDDFSNKFFSQDAFPHYDVSKDGNTHTLTVALAGFSIDDIEVVVEQKDGTTLIVRTKKVVDDFSKNVDVEYTHRGIAMRSFERRFKIYRNLEVISASMDNGLLTITLKGKPEEENVKYIPITIGNLKQLTVK